MRKLTVLLIIFGILFLVNLDIISNPKDTVHCCNDDNPSLLKPGGTFSYFCYNGEVLQEIEISYNCCWDEWAANGWEPPKI